MSRKTPKPLTPGQKIIFVRLFPLIFIAAGIAGSYFCIQSLLKARASLAWPSVEGRIVFSELDRRSARSGGKSRTRYSADIKYEYSVEDQPYEGTRVNFSGTGSEKLSHANAFVTQFPVDKIVPVYYQPDDPTQSVLINGVDINLYVGLGAGLFFLIAGVAMAVYFPIAAKKQEANA